MSDCKPTATGRGERWSTEPLTPEQQQLAERWVGAARTHARQMVAPGSAWRDDHESAAMLALVKAAKNFDPTKNIKFYTYLLWHLKHARKEVARQRAPQGYRVTGSLLAKREQIEGSRPSIYGIDPAECPHHDPACVDTTIQARQLWDWVRHHLSDLDSLHQQVLYLMYRQGLFAQEVADEWGCKRSLIVKIHDEAIERLKQHKGDLI